MSSIFISYRSSDRELVADLFESLSTAFGADQICMDRSTFIPGADWLQQIRAQVASADCLVIAIGPGWLSQEPADLNPTTVDYVVEELSLARHLRKPIVPVLLEVSAKQVSLNLPVKINWINKLHFVQWQRDTKRQSTLILSISNIAGVQQASVTTNKSHTSAKIRSTIRSAMTRSFGSLISPVGYAATSLRPNTQNLAVSIAQAAFAVALLVVTAILLSGDISAYSTAKILLSMTILAAFAFVGHVTSQHLTKSPVSGLSSSSFALHFAATLNTLIALWSLVLWLGTPDSVHQTLTSLTDSELPLEQNLYSKFSTLTRESIIFLALLNGAFSIHTIYLVYGNARAVAISLGSRQWLPIAILAIVTYLGFNASLWLITGADGIRLQNLPMQLKMKWIQDKITTQGIQRAPILLEAAGIVDKQDDLISFNINYILIENRQETELHLISMHCSLGVLSKGEFEWTNPLLEGRVPLNRRVPPRNNTQFQNLNIQIPTNSTAASGTTVLNCYIDVPGASYPLGDGKWTVLRW
jgi:hypothetical protein